MLKRIERSAMVPYSSEQLFELVNDVESYPRFLPYWSSVHIQESTDSYQIVNIEVSKGPLKQSFSTKNTWKVPTEVQMDLIKKGPFSHFKGIWRFKPLLGGGSEVLYTMEFEIQLGWLKPVIEPFFASLMETMMSAFLEEAAKRYDIR